MPKTRFCLSSAPSGTVTTSDRQFSTCIHLKTHRDNSNQKHKF